MSGPVEEVAADESAEAYHGGGGSGASVLREHSRSGDGADL